MKVSAWTVHTGGEPMVLEEREERPGTEEALVEVAGCGVCHTDLGFYYGGVPTRHGFPLTLGHEVSGTVVEANEELLDRPELINESPYGEGWMIVVEVSNPEELQQLLSAADYQAYTEQEKSEGA